MTTLPYPDPVGGPSEGWSGSATSRDRALRAAASGEAGVRQKAILTLLDQAGPTGMTCHEFEVLTGVGHGPASGSFSVLHKSGAISRLEQSRQRNQVYVLPKHVLGRTEAPYVANRGNRWQDGYDAGYAAGYMDGLAAE